MAVRTGVVLQLGLISTQVTIESAVTKDESLKTVCVGVIKSHVPAGVTQRTTCPECGNVGVEKKSTKARGEFRKCLKCQNEWDVVPAPDEVAVVG